MSITYAAVSGTNTFVPNMEATGGLTVAFSRNPSDFSFNEYVQIVNVDKWMGYYATYRSQNSFRMTNTDMARYAWPYGAPAPLGLDETDKFSFNPYECRRFLYPYAVPMEAADQADFDDLALERKGAAQRAMTARGQLISSALTGASWADDNHTSSATSLGGGLFSAGTETNPYIKYGLTKAMISVGLATGNAVKKKDFIVVMNPNTAADLAKTQEMHSYFSRSPFAKEVTERDGDWLNEYGLPKKVAGFTIVVDDTAVITSKDGASSLVAGFTIPDNKMYMVARPGKLKSEAGNKAFSTVTLFVHNDEMTTEEKVNKDDRLYQGRVIQSIQAQVISTKVGFEITNVIS